MSDTEAPEPKIFGMSQDQALLIGGALAVAVVGAFVLRMFLRPSYGLDKNTWRKFKIVRKENITHNTRRFRCALQTPQTILGLPCGKHMTIRGMAAPDFKEEISRPYTPTSSDDHVGYFELVIKIYDDGPKGPGKLTAYLDTLNEGDYIEAKGPSGRIHYKSDCLFSLFNPLKKTSKEHHVTHLNMIAGGTGLTPMYQVIQEIIAKGHETKVKMIFGNVSVDDILCRSEMELFGKHKNIDVVFTLDRAPADGSWKGEVGYVTAEMIKKHMFPPGPKVATLICGPPGLVKGSKGACKKLGYDKDRVWCF